MTKYIVTGGKRLTGEVKVHGAKNAGFKAMIAALLCDSPSEIHNLSHVGDIQTTKEVIECLGGKVTGAGERSLKIDPKDLNSFDAPKSCGAKSRAGMMFAGPLLSKFGQAILPVPGGDKIGARPIDRHLAGLTSLGAKVELKNNVFYISAPNGLHGANFRFKKNTHTGTETLIMAAVKAKGKTILENAAAEPEIDNLIDFLNKCGGKIFRPEPRTIVIEGREHLNGCVHEMIFDRNATVTYACAALATKGEIEIVGADKKVLETFLKKVQEIGGGVEATTKGLRFYYKGQLQCSDVVAAPYPAFMTDWQAVWATLMTQATGTAIIHETIFENRFGYAPLLTSMGAKIELFNPEISEPEQFYNFNLDDDKPEFFHAMKVFGPTSLMGREVTVNDVRMGATMILAGLVAHGQTTIIDPSDQVTRGYENLAENLVNLGAKIEIVPADSVAYLQWRNY